MELYIKLVLLTLGLVLFAVAGLAVKIFFKREGEFSGSSCSSYNPKLKDEGIGCGCGSTSCES